MSPLNLIKVMENAINKNDFSIVGIWLKDTGVTEITVKKLR